MKSQQDAFYAVLDASGTCVGVGSDPVDAMQDAVEFLLHTGQDPEFHDDGSERTAFGVCCTAEFCEAVASRPAGVERTAAGRTLNSRGVFDLRSDLKRRKVRARRLVVQQLPERSAMS